MGQIPVKGPAMATVNTAVTQITGNATITGAIGSGVSASRDSSEDTFSNKFTKAHCPGLRAASGWHYGATVHPGDSLRFAPGPPGKDRSLI